jgi:hypothetical protein
MTGVAATAQAFIGLGLLVLITLSLYRLVGRTAAVAGQPRATAIITLGGLIGTLLAGSTLVAAVRLADQPLAYDVTFAAIAAALAWWAGARPAHVRNLSLLAAWKPFMTTVRPTLILKIIIPLAIAAAGLGIAWRSNGTELRQVTALSASRQPSAVAVVVTRARDETRPLGLQVVEAGKVVWRKPTLPDNRTVRITAPVANTVSKTASQVQLLADGQVIRTVSLP